MAHAAHSLAQEAPPLQGGLSGDPGSLWLTESRGAVAREIRIAGAIVEAARTEAVCLGGARLLRIGVSVGADCAIHPWALTDAFSRRCRGTELEHVELHVKSVPRRSVCHICGRDFSPAGPASRCPICLAPDPELVGGDELELTFIEVERG